MEMERSCHNCDAFVRQIVKGSAVLASFMAKDKHRVIGEEGA